MKLVRLNIIFFVLLTVLASSAFAVKKPRSAQKTCITSECHTDRADKEYVHGPVDLGDCNACHEAVSEKEHTFKPKHKGAALCSSSSCHLEQISKK
ncbi:hypothetical protein LCGC14_3131470, partial [marine sediment metagenome]